MKKIFAVVLLAVAFAMPSKAQFSWGIQAGLNMSNISVKDAADNVGTAVKSRTGFFVGPTVKFTLPLVGLGIDASALYDQREGKAGDETIKSQSIQIPSTSVMALVWAVSLRYLHSLVLSSVSN